MKDPNPLLPLPELLNTPARLTTRDIADRMKAAGAAADALPDAAHLADGATYQEVVCRSALNRVEGMPFRYTLNPYRGCTHGCHYCFARRYHTQFEMGAGDDFSSVILVKANFVEVLRKELDRPSWKNEQIALGTATDPYQPIEGHYKLTRGALEALVAARSSVGVITKGPMAIRDKDLLAELGRRGRCTVYFSVPTVDEDAWRILEPGTAHPMQRLRAVRELRDAGVRVGVLMAPIVPGLTSHPAKMERTIKAIADHGAAFVGANVLHLQQGTRTHFMSFLERSFPDLSKEYRRLYAGDYAPKSYTSEVQAMVKMLQARHGLLKRPHATTPGEGVSPGASDSTTSDHETQNDQSSFDWSVAPDTRD